MQFITLAALLTFLIQVADQDTNIWEAFRKGDKAAFEQLLLGYYRPMFDYGIRFQSDPERLRDDLHDLLVSLWERREYLHNTENLKLYLFKALRHQIFRGKHKQPYLTDWEGLEEEAAEEPRLGFVEEEAFKRQSHQIQHTLLRLSRRQQEVLHLKFFEELSNEQIAHLLGISRAATANLLYTALRAFKALWKAEYYLLLAFLFC